MGDLTLFACDEMPPPRVFRGVASLSHGGAVSVAWRGSAVGRFASVGGAAAKLDVQQAMRGMGSAGLAVHGLARVRRGRVCGFRGVASLSHAGAVSVAWRGNVVGRF